MPVFISGGTPTQVVYTPVYGSFYDTTDQSSASDVVKAMELNTTDTSIGVTIANNTLSRPTRITVSNSGVYNLQFSAQLYRTSGGQSKTMTIWIRVNEVNVPASATIVTMQANADYLVAAWNWYVTLTANQYVEIMYVQNDSITIEYVPEDLVTPHPAVPSVIVTMNKIS